MGQSKGGRKRMIKTINKFGYLIILLAVGIFGFFSANGYPEVKKAYGNISVEQFIKLMDQKDFILINVHIPYQGEIPNTDTLIPFNSMDQHRGKLPNDKNAKIVVYCMTGPMGYIAAGKLVDMGYTSVVHFEGGMQAWVNSGRQLRFLR
jgi:rhodanese-related sulfurtransferase